MTDFHPTPQQRRFGRGKIVLVVLGGLMVFGVALFLILRTALGPVTEAGDNFMGALRDGNYPQAYALAAPDLQQTLGSAERLGATTGAYRPLQWSWSTRSVRNGYGKLGGSATYQSGNNGTAELRLVKVDGQWRVNAFRLN